jgi:hypothetical protein
VIVPVLLEIGWLFEEKQPCGLPSPGRAAQAANRARVWDRGLGGDASFPFGRGDGIGVAARCVGDSADSVSRPRVSAFCIREIRGSSNRACETAAT